MPKRILVADDEPSIIMGLKFILEDSGYELIEASDGIEALKQARTQKPDLILLDIMMPPSGKNEGIDVCKMLKSNRGTKHIPIIMVTVKGSKEDMKQAFEAGASDYITKPFDTDDLIRKIRKFLD